MSNAFCVTLKTFDDCIKLYIVLCSDEQCLPCFTLQCSISERGLSDLESYNDTFKAHYSQPPSYVFGYHNNIDYCALRFSVVLASFSFIHIKRLCRAS